uniref:dolichyl-phosphate-mannose--protein mannosyltransferase n=1 Tax=Strigamia maritima TaxID=126957 RepID=T1J5F2_STRMM
MSLIGTGALRLDYTITRFPRSLSHCRHKLNNVTGVVGRAEILSSLFFIISLTCYIRSTGLRKETEWGPLLLTPYFGTIAMLCKEQGVTVLGVCCVYEIFIAQKMRLQDILNPAKNTAMFVKASLAPWVREMGHRLAFLVGFMFVLVLLRINVMGAQLPVFTRKDQKFDNPASVAPTPVRHLTYNYLCVLNAWLLCFPCDLCCDWTMGTIPLVDNFSDPRLLAIAAFYLSLVKLGHFALTAPMRHARVVIISLSLMIFPYLPASNLFFPVGFVVAERILYAPSMGFCMLVAHGLCCLQERSNFKKLVSASLAILLLLHAAKTVIRNFDWESEYTIFMAGLRVNQRNAKLFNNVGHALEGEGKFIEALEYFRKAVIVQPDDIGAHINVGRTFNNLRRFKQAEDAYMKAKDLLPKPRPGEPYQTRIAPSHLNVFLNLANLIAKNESRLEEADSLYRQAISMRADYTQAYINRGDVLIKLNRTKEAQEVYEKALQYDNSNPDIYYNLGVVFLEQGKTLEALAYLDKALELDPEHEQALMNSAILIQESGNPQLRKVAYERLIKLMKKDQQNERIYFNLGMLAMDDKDYVNAEKWFKMSIQLKQDFRSALFNLALLLSDAHRPLEAAPFLNHLLKFHPDHIKGLILLGDIYINNIKDLNSAEKCYRKILELDPHNVQGMHNLCVVYVERGELKEAEACLTAAHQVAPNEEYILRHLRIVRARLLRQHAKDDEDVTGASNQTANQDNSQEEVT